MPEEELNQGIIEAYIHQNKRIGAMIELRCETDFVARTEEFKKLAHELCLQIVAMKPLFLKAEDIPEEFLAGKKKEYQEQFTLAGSAVDEIVEEKLKKYKEEISLLSQPWIKDETKTIKELIDEYIAKLGENIVIKRFIRYEL